MNKNGTCFMAAKLRFFSDMTKKTWSKTEIFRGKALSLPTET
jgi:hypothetical protein